ncbi:MAG: NAD-dependent epimerase/dehydratase family protein [Minisyncoccia bacterium]
MQKTVVVTGGAGFIGTHLCRRLHDEGHRVISLDNYFAGSKENHVSGVEYREGHTKHIESLVPETPDLIFHLGEYARVEQSVLEPDLVRDLNTEGTKAVVAWWQKRKCKLVYAGSSTKFGTGVWAKDTVPYVTTKAENTELVKAVGDQEHLPYAITYFYNVYGPGERAGVYGTVVEAFRQMYLSGAPLAVTSPGTQERNFTHIDDIVSGLMLVGERGQGDEFGLGCERPYTILELAELFGGEVVMLPARSASRTSSALDVSKAYAIGWKTHCSLEEYVRDFVRTHTRGVPREKRVLVLSTTFHPIAGPAEDALLALIHKMPDVTFDVVTTVFRKETHHAVPLAQNVQVYRVGFGTAFDKLLLPILGLMKALSLHERHHYLFVWSIMASYAGLAGMLLKRVAHLPLLITLADQRIDRLSSFQKTILSILLSDADQVYGMDAKHEAQAAVLSKRPLARASLGEGDAFANQLRYAYADILLTKPPQP